MQAQIRLFFLKAVWSVSSVLAILTSILWIPDKITKILFGKKKVKSVRKSYVHEEAVLAPLWGQKLIVQLLFIVFSY